MGNIVLVLWGNDANIGSKYGIQGQKYVALLQGNKMTAEFNYRNLILVI